MINDPIDDDDGDESSDDYEQYFGMMKQYSDLIFKTRVYIVTVCLAYWYYISNLKELNAVAQMVGPCPLTRLGIIGCAFIAMFMVMELVYIKQYWAVVCAGREYESRHRKVAFFSTLNLAWRRYHVFYVANGMAMIGMGGESLREELNKPNMILDFTRSIATAAGCIFAIGAYAFYFVRDFNRGIKNQLRKGSPIEHAIQRFNNP
jgi:hypothetical protein